ncbi:MAG TPA: hypothetical protein VJH24_01195 [Candidatus Bilamarchaeaceae archaeon]|nr:hypothetical protein [Candidatus Bilamarchaeaceae archaeon]
MEGIPLSRGTPMRCVARTQSLEEATQVRDRFEAQGFQTQIVERKQGALRLYEVWIGKQLGLEAKR